PLENWRAMLLSLSQDTPPEFVDWFAVERIAGRDIDIGMHRNWIDPSIPFTDQVVRPSHGALITSATLRDGTGDEDSDWRAADLRTGAPHLMRPAERAVFASPFDYPAQTRVFVVSDVNKNDTRQLAAAFRELMRASGGGAIGLFTSIARLRNVHGQLARSGFMEDMTLLSQHIDPLDTGTLVDIFRAEEDSCLLGTDAVRDGVDVPGRSLRLLIYERVPWPRPTILHKARKKAYGSGYDDMLTRLKLKQAYGRLIRGRDDHGVFVLLDRALPSRLLGAFPDGVEIEKVGLADAITGVRQFLNQD
ncbi:MAG: ATP-dependent DNA helicase, partial [Proteobacteria bacterium]|nr:ATP-dependent DNA helicase [Pseudomonadota bacterium]